MANDRLDEYRSGCSAYFRRAAAGSLVLIAFGLDSVELLTPGSTQRVAQTVTHAGIVKTRQFSFLL
jgi:hypothetical protein